jgi:hypothetical protein
MYLITDSENKTWRGEQWDINVTHTEGNDNYHFFAYTNPLTALFMYPAYEGDINNPQLWKGKGEELSKDWGIRCGYGKFTTLEKLEVTFPTEEQSMIFGFINALAVARNKTFNDWALKFLKKEDESLETANKMLDDIMGEDSCGCAFALVGGMEKKDFHRYGAYASHRAWHDSLDQRLPVDLEQAAQVALTLPLEDIVQILG